MAAARCVTHTPAEAAAELAERIDHLADRRRVVDRHHSIEAAIDWSYELLAPAE